MKKDKISGECINCIHASKVVDKISPNDPDCIYCHILLLGRVARGERSCNYYINRNENIRRANKGSR